jgi:protocatechuate 3,4-dioxygenase beta subunit
VRSRILLCLLLFLALGWLGVALLVDTRDASVLAGRNAAGANGRSFRADLAAGAADPEGQNAASASGAGRVPLGSMTEADIAAEAAAKLPPRVTGRALSPAGAALPGALVFASSGEHWGLIPLDIEPEAIPRGWPEIQRTETDAEGRFVFEKLKSGPLRLVIRAHGCTPLRQDRLAIPPAYKLHDLGDFALAQGVTLAGKVVDRAGHGIAGARIFQVLESGAGAQGIAAPGRGLPLGASGAEGAFTLDELAAGPWRLLFDAPGFAVGEEEGRSERAGETQKGLYVRLESGMDTCGRVLADPGSPLPPGLCVQARLSEERDAQSQPQGADAGPAPSRLLRTRSGAADAEGNFCLAGLERARRYRFTLWQDGPDGKQKRVPGVEALSAWAGERGITFRLKPAATLTFHVVDASSGAALEEFCVWAGIGRERLLRDEKNEARRRFEGGRVECPDLQPQTPSRPAIVRVRAVGYRDYENKNVQLRAGAPTDLGEIRLEHAALVHVRVLDARDDKPVEGARIVCGLQEKGDPADYLSGPDEQEFWGDLNWQFARSAKDGTACFSSTPGKAVALRADAKGLLDSETLKQILPSEGDATAVLRLAHGGRVHVRVGDGFGRAVRGVGIGHKPPGAGGRADDEWQVDQAEQKSDALGEARFEALVPGMHAFRVHDQAGQVWHQLGSAASAQGWVQVTVAEGSEETLELLAPPRGTVEGSVREGGRPLEGANLRLVELREGEDAGEQGWMGPNDPCSTVTDHLGHFRYEGLRCGSYALVIHHPSRRMPARFPIEVRAAERSVEFDLDVTAIDGRVCDLAGRPLAGLEVWAYPLEGQGQDQEPYQIVLREDERGSVRVNYEQTARRSARTDAQGRYELRGLAPNLPLRVHVEGESVETFDSPPITLAPDELRHGLDFALRMAGTIRVELEGGEPNQGSWYEVRALLVHEGKEELRSSTWIGPWNRRDDMRALAPGHYKLVCTRQGGAGGPEPAVQEVDLHEGETLEVRFQAR